MKNELDLVSGALGYSYAAMAIFTLLQLLTLCGICKASDACFQDRREYLQDGGKGKFEDIEGSYPKTSADSIELPDRANKYKLRRNFDIE